MLASCVARVDADGHPIGTAFFVAPGWAVTAAHVAEWHGRTLVMRVREQSLTGTVVKVWPLNSSGLSRHPLPDLALVRLDETDHPCVRLADQAPNMHTKFMALGFTRTLGESFARLETTTDLKYGGEMSDPDESGTELYKIVDGSVPEGMSGGPVIDVGAVGVRGTGAVVGLMRTSRDLHTDMGGWVVRSEEIRALLGTERMHEHHVFHEKDQRWDRAWAASAWRFSSPADMEDVWWLRGPIVPFAPGKLLEDARNKYLSSQNLDYLDIPDFDRAWLLNRLETERRGVLLVGAAGAGKTRLAVEIAHLATEKGWPVWLTRSPGHSQLPGISKLSVEDLRKVVFSPDSRKAQHVLVVLDYLDSYHQNLDFEDLQRLVDDAFHNDGIRVMLLATARPGARHRLAQLWAGTVLDFMDLPSSPEHRRKLVRQILTRIAGTALQRWGFDEVRRRCGGDQATPMVTLLMAVALERGNQHGSAAPEPLVTWLRSRLTSDELAGAAAAADNAPSSADLLAYAVIAATCRRQESSLESTAHAVVDRYGGGARQNDHLTRLEQTGWLIPDDNDGAVVDPRFDLLHDLVADLLLDGALFTPSGGVDKKAVHAALDAVASDPVALEQFCVPLSRVYDRQGRRNRSVLRVSCKTWLDGNAQSLGARFRAAGAASAGALYALLHHLPWSSGEPWIEPEATAGRLPPLPAKPAGPAPSLVTPHFATLVGPQPDASVLIESLRSTPGDQPVRAAVVWLSGNRASPQVPQVLTHLVRRDVRIEDLSGRIGTYVTAWLSTVQDGVGQERLLIACLLNKQLSVSEHEPAIVAFARAAVTSLSSPASYDLYAAMLDHDAIVGRSDGDLALRALQAAREHPEHVSAGLLMQKLLPHHDIHEHKSSLTDMALTWSRRNLGSHRSPHVLQALLAAWQAATKAQRDAIVNQTLAWLGREVDAPAVPYVIERLLPLNGLVPHQVTRAVQQTIRWAQRPQHLRWSTDKVLPPHVCRLVAQAMKLIVADPVEAMRVADVVYRMLPSDRPAALTPSHSHLLHALLVGAMPKSLRELVIDLSLRWLKLHAHTPQAGWVLQALVRREELAGTRLATVMDAINEWMYRHNIRAEAPHVIEAALGRTDLTGSQRTTVVEHAEAIIAEQQNVAVPQGLFLALSKATPGAGNAGVPAIPNGTQNLLGWLEKHRDEYESGYAAIKLLSKSLSVGQLDRVVAVVAAWVPRHADRATVPILLRMLLCHRHVSGEDRGVATTAVVPAAVKWARTYPAHQRAGGVLSALLSYSPLTQHDREALSSLAFDWLERHEGLQTRGFVLGALMHESHSKARTKSLVAWSLAWLAQRPDLESTGVLAQAMVNHDDLSTAQRQQMISPLLDWLESHGSDNGIRRRLLGFWGNKMVNLTMSRDQADRLGSCVLGTVQHFDEPIPGKRYHYDLNGCLAAGLSPDTLDPVVAQALVKRAFEWLERDTDPLDNTLNVYRLRVLVKCKHLTAPQAKRALSAAARWLSDRPLGPEAKVGSLVIAVVQLKAPSMSLVHTLVDVALRWISQNPDDHRHGLLLLYILRRDDLTEDDVHRCLAAANSILADPKVSDEQRTHATNAVLRRRETTGATARSLITSSIARLASHSGRPKSNLLLGLLCRTDLTGTEKAVVVDASVSYLTGRQLDRTDGELVEHLLAHTGTHHRSQDIVALAISWIGKFNKVPSSPYVVRALIRSPAATAEVRSVMVTAMTQWLHHFCTRNSAPQAIMAVVEAGTTEKAELAMAVQYGLTWLNGRETYLDGDHRSLETLAAELIDGLSRLPDLDAYTKSELERLRSRTT
nr:trypsin-like peptidase domain-containing protein [Kibdelosporangium phytohabitans]